ncbi:MAG: glycosyltransferase [Akkermansiaceae bacterium]|nr:glycosyltransferase [Armatimonadota bacterium]
MRVLFVASEQEGSATFRYRSENLARCLRRSGHIANVVYVGQSRVRVDADVVVLHRVCAVPEGLAFARAAREIGAMLVYSTDDTVYDAQSFPDYGEPWGTIRAYAPRHAEMLAEADAVLASTDYLARDISRMFGPEKPTFTVRNFLSEELLRLSETAGRQQRGKDKGVVTFGYMSGSATHNVDISVATPALYEILLSREKVRLLLVGPLLVDSALGNFERFGKVVRAPFVSWQKLPEIIAATDVNLSPLNLNHRFVRGKSEIKFLEAAAAGVPTIATATEGFTEAVPPDAIAYSRDAADGYGTNDNLDWFSNLERLLDPDARRDLAERAYLHTLTHGTEEAQSAHVGATFERIAALPRKGRGDTTQNTGRVWVNFPFAPPKYLAKAILRATKR